MVWEALLACSAAVCKREADVREADVREADGGDVRMGEMFERYEERCKRG